MTFNEFSNRDCEFSYRDSIFKKKPIWVVTEVHFKLLNNGKPTVEYKDLIKELENSEKTLQTVREAVLKIRSAKSMVLDKKDPNSKSAGSFFIHPIITKEQFEKIPGEKPYHWELDNGKIKLSAAWLIEQAGFPKGHIYNKNVGLSEKHALAIINRANATSDEILDFAQEIIKKVNEKYSVELEIEPIIIQ